MLRGDGFEFRGFLFLFLFSFKSPGGPAQGDDGVRGCHWRVLWSIFLVWTARLDMSFLFFSFLSIHKTVTLIWPKRIGDDLLFSECVTKRVFWMVRLFFLSLENLIDWDSLSEYQFEAPVDCDSVVVYSELRCAKTMWLWSLLYLKVEDKTSESVTAAPQAR